MAWAFTQHRPTLSRDGDKKWLGRLHNIMPGWEGVGYEFVAAFGRLASAASSHNLNRANYESHSHGTLLLHTIKLTTEGTCTRADRRSPRAEA